MQTAAGSNLVVRGLTKTYRGSRTPANRSISLEFRPGELVALIGHNGAGKTTLLNQLVGIARPDAGDVTYAGVSLVMQPSFARRLCSMMPQLHAPLQGVTPRQAVCAIARLRGGSGRAVKDGCRHLFADLDIERWAAVPGQKLSGGLRRLTSYAMAVVHPPPVLLIDEPTNDVDPVRRNLIWRHLRQLADRGHIVLVVTHNLLEVERSADRFVLLQEGAVRTDGTPRQLAAQAGDMVLTINLRDPDRTFEPAVEHLSSSRVDSAGQMRLYLAASQIPAAVRWAQLAADQGEIDSYSLGPVALDTLYEGITHVG